MAIDLCCCSCGGTLDISKSNKQTIKCDFCGKEQIIPNVDNEARLKTFNRVTDLRLHKQFDEAQRIYESMLLQFPDDYELHWGLCLCKYGVEYVDDYDGSKIPICHRNLYDSILNDEDYLFAVSNCDGVSKDIIENDARYIDTVQKKYIQISSTEKPYDVFLSYKETEFDGRSRTQDSLLAEQIYDELVKEKYKVFFSRISLEDKLGMDYEPNIEYALMSAKVMLLVGTSVENINSTWVKSEWSRFLKFMQKERGKKYLIPCFYGFDPYDLPYEISSFQAQDLSKIGATKDIVRGVRKLISPSNPENLSHIIDALKQNGVNSNASNFLRRAEIFIERGELDEARKALNNCLNGDPENAKAYMLYALLDYGVRSLEELDTYCPKSIDYETIIKTRIRNVVSGFKTSTKTSENFPFKNPYVPVQYGNRYSQEEYEYYFIYGDNIEPLLLSDDEARSIFNYPLIDQSKDYQTALKFADDQYREEILKHFELSKENREERTVDFKNEFEAFVKKKYEYLKNHYLNICYHHAKTLPLQKKCETYLLLGDYHDSHELAIKSIREYIHSDSINVSIDKIIENKSISSLEKQELLDEYSQVWMSKTKSLENNINNLNSDVRHNININYNENIASNHVEEFAKIAEELKNISEFTPSTQPSSGELMLALSKSLETTRTSLHDEAVYSEKLRKRKLGFSSSTFFVVLMISAICLMIVRGYDAVIFQTQVDKDFGQNFIRLFMFFGPTAFLIFIVGLSSRKAKSDLLGIFVVSLFLGGCGIGAAASLVVYLAGPFLAFPIIAAKSYASLIIIGVESFVVAVTLFVELAKHAFMPATIRWYVFEFLTIIFAVVVTVLLIKNLDYINSKYSLPDFGKLLQHYYS